MSHRSNLVALLSERLGTTKVAADGVLMTVVTAMQEYLDSNGEVVLPGFGRLKNHTRAARQGRNPRTGASIQVPEKTVTKFKAFPPAEAGEAAAE